MFVGGVCSVECFQTHGAASTLCLSTDHASFHVGYKRSGVVETYSVAEGFLLWSTEAHAGGDVNSLTELQPGLICTAGSDCRVGRPYPAGRFVPCCQTEKSKKLSYRLGTAPQESLPKIAEMDVEMTT